jgi:fatty-acyl-CoA synthase
MNFTVSDILSKRVSSRGAGVDDIALIFEDRKWTFGELEERIGRLTAGLLDAGFSRGDTAAVISHNRPEWIELFFAIARIGGVIVPINFFLKPEEITFILDDSHTSWVFCEEQFWSILEDDRESTDRRYVALGSSRSGTAYEGLISDRNAPAQPDVRVDDLFTLLYTSGTTGLPKGAMHSQATVLWNTFHQIPDFRVTADDVWLTVPSLCWGAGFHDLTLATWWVGGKVVLKESTGFDAARFADLIKRQGVTKTLLVPSALRRVLEEVDSDSTALSTLGLVLVGGESVPLSVLQTAAEQLPTCKVSQVYGMSEFPSLMLYLDPEHAAARIGSAGKACSISLVRVVDEHGDDVSGDSVGEIICRSPAVMLGYLGLPGATSETLRDGWLRTGDLARVDEDGYIYIVGRAKDMYISGGLNVYPAEVERAIVACPGVQEAAVVGVADEQWGEAGHAIVVLSAESDLKEPELRELLQAKLANYKLPRRIDLRSEALPRTTSGKVQKTRLRDELAGATAAN